MEIQGKMVRLGNLTEGTSPRGAWRKQELIIETIEQYPKQVCLVCWNDRVAEAQNFRPGQIIKAQIRAELSIYIRPVTSLLSSSSCRKYIV